MVQGTVGELFLLQTSSNSYLDGSLPVELAREDVEEVWVREAKLWEPILVAEGVVEDVEAVQLPHTITRQKLVVQAAWPHSV